MGVDWQDELEKRKLMSEPKFGRELSKFMHLELGCSGAAGAAGAVERVPGSGAHYGAGCQESHGRRSGTWLMHSS